jgi:hypothetical protein
MGIVQVIDLAPGMAVHTVHSVPSSPAASWRLERSKLPASAAATSSLEYAELANRCVLSWSARRTSTSCRLRPAAVACPAGHEGSVDWNALDAELLVVLVVHVYVTYALE